MRFVIVGGGFTGARVARRALAHGAEVVATTRSAARATSLRAMGVTPLVHAVLSPDALAPHVDEDACVLVTMPPDGASDALLAGAPWLARAAAVAYVSSTGVYGDAASRVDESTRVDDSKEAPPRARSRLLAERVWRDAGASIVRAPAIYGPGRGMHLRLARGELRVAEGATNAISRVHVDDLAAALHALLVSRTREAIYVMGDMLPAPQIEVVQWLCEALAIPLPPPMPKEQLDETLRHDRRIDAVRIRADLGLSLAYPTFREGYAQCIAEDRRALDEALASSAR